MIQPFKQETNPENILTENCTICQNKEYIEYDYGIPICQTCYFRRNLFLYGSELKCVSCDIQLRDDSFEAYIGESWCKRCVAMGLRDMVGVDGRYVSLVEHVKFDRDYDDCEDDQLKSKMCFSDSNGIINETCLMPQITTSNVENILTIKM